MNSANHSWKIVLRSLVLLVMAQWTMAANAQVKIGVMVSSTGPGSVVGIPQKNSAELLPKRIGNLSVRYIILNDGGDPTSAVNNVKKLMFEDKVDGLIGPSLSPCAMAVLPFVAGAKTPMIAAVGTDAVIRPMDAERHWVFKTAQANNLILKAEVGNMSKSAVKTVGLIRLSDALGEEWAQTLKPLLAKAHIKLVADERFQRSDNSVIGQALHLIEAKPDAVLVAAVGGSSVLAEVTLRDEGYKGKIYQTNGAASNEFTKLGGKKVEGTLMAAGPLQVVAQLPNDNPIKKVALAYTALYQKAYGVAPSTFGSNVYDAGLIYQRAIPIAAKLAKPGTPEFRADLRDAIEQTTNLVGTQGVFNMTPMDHNGMDSRAALMMVVRDGKWTLLQNSDQ